MDSKVANKTHEERHEDLNLSLSHMLKIIFLLNPFTHKFLKWTLPSFDKMHPLLQTEVEIKIQEQHRSR